MGETLVQIIFGGPAIITSILLLVAGIWLKKPALAVASGFLCIPFTYYISNGFRTTAFLFPFFAFGCAYAIKHQRMLTAWLLTVPLIVVAIVLAYIVLTQ